MPDSKTFAELLKELNRLRDENEYLKNELTCHQEDIKNLKATADTFFEYNIRLRKENQSLKELLDKRLQARIPFWRRLKFW